MPCCMWTVALYVSLCLSLQRVSASENMTLSEELINEDAEKRSDEGWSSWSEWSTCSRTCDGGAAYQLRQCKSPSGCRGERIRYKICSMQPCPEPGDFRAQQCEAFRELPYQGNYYEWEPHYDDSEPCVLTCKAKGEEDVVARLANKVEDGTRCRPGSLDMCIGGQCQRVGCDLRIGSVKRVDDCGVCGGDGSSCVQPLYHWEETPMSLCSVTCGGGYKMSRPVCKNRISGDEVSDEFCNMSKRPTPRIVECNTHRCPAKWVSEAWGPCSVTCGGGVRFRHVFCGEDRNSSKVKVPDHLCHGHKPRYQESCSIMDCPRWYSGAWSGCSVSCGEGVQTRNVFCRDAVGHPSPLCDELHKPLSTQPCRTGIACAASRFHGSEEDGEEDIEELPGMEHTQPLIQQIPPSGMGTAPKLVDEQMESDPAYVAENWGICSVSCGEGIRKREVHCKIFLEFSKTMAKLPDKECPGPKPVEVERCIMKPCSFANSRRDTIQDGFDGVYQDASRNAYKETISAVSGRNPAGTKADTHITYSWKLGTYTSCSASCLGGVQESIVQCVRDQDNKVVTPYLCPAEKRPDTITRTCNDHPCPPRWNVSDFAPCTKPCGQGIQVREVHCIHEVTRGGSNTLPVPSERCPQPPPRSQLFCNVFDCPEKWEVGDWSKCSKSCGGGWKSRPVKCQQVLALGHVQDMESSHCSDNKPVDRRACNQRPCREEAAPRIASTNQSYVQETPKEKLTLKVGGRAVVFQGTTVKIKCPVKRFNRAKIMWAKNHEYIKKSKKYGVSKKGALRIREVTYSDSGIYTCIAGQSSANLTLTVKQIPSHFLASEEMERTRGIGARNPSFGSNIVGPGSFETKEDPNGDAGTRHYVLSAAGSSGQARKPFIPYDDYSHELKNGGKTWPPTEGSVPPEESGKDEKGGRKKGKGKGKGKGRQRARQGGTVPTDVDGHGNNVDADGVTRAVDTWDTQHGSTLVADQERDALESSFPTATRNPHDSAQPHMPSSLEIPEDISSPPQSSGSSRPMPHFQTLLAHLQNLLPFQSFGTGTKTRSQPPGFLSTVLNDDPQYNGDDYDDPQHQDRIDVLGRGSPEHLQFDWLITDWSRCSQTCGSSGFQVRATQCIVRLHNVSRTVENNLCEDAGLSFPATIQKCGLDACPHWSAHDWTRCESSRCFSWNTAMQKRDVKCLLPNGTEVNPKYCSENLRPPRKRECYNEKCNGTWKVSEWSEVTTAETIPNIVG